MPLDLSYLKETPGTAGAPLPFAGANVNDPSQFLNWDRPYLAIGRQAAGMDLYDPETLKQLQGIFGPLFNQQFTNLNTAANTQGNMAAQSAGAGAAARNLANPMGFTSSARQRVLESFAPQYGELQASQQGNLLNAAAQSKQFNIQNLMNLAQMYQGVDQMRMQNFMQDRQAQNQPSFFENLFGGLIQGGAQVGMGVL